MPGMIRVEAPEYPCFPLGVPSKERSTSGVPDWFHLHPQNFFVPSMTVDAGLGRVMVLWMMALGTVACVPLDPPPSSTFTPNESGGDEVVPTDDSSETVAETPSAPSQPEPSQPSADLNSCAGGPAVPNPGKTAINPGLIIGPIPNPVPPSVLAEIAAIPDVCIEDRNTLVPGTLLDVVYGCVLAPRDGSSCEAYVEDCVTGALAFEPAILNVTQGVVSPRCSLPRFGILDICGFDEASSRSELTEQGAIVASPSDTCCYYFKVELPPCRDRGAY